MGRMERFWLLNMAAELLECVCVHCHSGRPATTSATDRQQAARFTHCCTPHFAPRRFAKKCINITDECLTTVCGTPGGPRCWLFRGFCGITLSLLSLRPCHLPSLAPSPLSQPDSCHPLLAPEYMAPEIVRGSSKARAMLEAGPSAVDGCVPYGAACDMWACGVILYMLLSGQAPFSSPSHPRLLRNIVAGRFSFEGTAWKRISPEAKDLIAKLLVVDPHQRLTASAALVHPWMRGSRGSARSARSDGLLHLAKRLARAASQRLSL